MTLTLHNTLTKRAEIFSPRNARRVTMYVCGPTVYGQIHIGNARAVVVFDLLFRLLRAEYGDDAVVYARNITDIDDKIIQAAKDADETPASLAARFADEFNRDADALGALPPTIAPRASEHIGQMCGMIDALLAKKCAYEAEGHILFRVANAPDYGILSKRGKDEMIAGARVEIAPYKKDPADFVLWKPAAQNDPGWDSPWGRGRPGWHLECSAMANAHLGEVIDIHGGGQDLIFPHHENEIAQSCCASGGDVFARYWVHNGHLTSGGEKMSKSLGNIVVLREMLAKYPGEALRYALLSGHYRQPLDFSDNLIKAAKTALDRLYRALVDAPPDDGGDDDHAAEARDALHQDMNTPLALRALHECAKKINKEKSPHSRARAQARLKAGGKLMGFFNTPAKAWLKGDAADNLRDAAAIGEDEIAAAIKNRNTARAERDFARADDIRAALQKKGVILQDSPAGTTWRRE
jgi:cysteinyl-tRNA synthetase